MAEMPAQFDPIDTSAIKDPAAKRFCELLLAQLQRNHNHTRNDILSMQMEASAAWNPGSVANGAEEAVDVTLRGAQPGDYALGSFSSDVADLVLDAQVTAANTVTCVLANNTGAAVDLGAGTVHVRVMKR